MLSVLIVQLIQFLMGDFTTVSIPSAQIREDGWMLNYSHHHVFMVSENHRGILHLHDLLKQLNPVRIPVDNVSENIQPVFIG